MAEFFDISPYQWSAILIGILCGGMIGFEMQLRGPNTHAAEQL